MQHEGYSGLPIHNVTLDEVQDFTQATLKLFFLVCRQPNGFFFTGDTCQTIARGVGAQSSENLSAIPTHNLSGFRFSELQQLFRREVMNHRYEKLYSIPEVHCLTHNYRSHRHLLEFGHTIVDLLELMYPRSIDHLPRDHGTTDGPLPVVLNDDDLFAILTRHQDASSPSDIEFGAEQVLI